MFAAATPSDPIHYLIDVSLFQCRGPGHNVGHLWCLVACCADKSVMSVSSHCV